MSWLEKLGDILDAAVKGLNDYINSKKRVTAPFLNRFLLIIFGSEVLQDPSYMSQMMELCNIFNSLDLDFSDSFEWFVSTNQELLKQAVINIQQTITFLMLDDEIETSQSFFKLLDYLFKGNMKRHP